MNPRLSHLFLSLEAQRTDLLHQIQAVAPEHLNHSQNNKWSISQIAGHLIQAEQMSVGYMSKKINAINQVGNTGLWNELMLGVFVVSQRLPLKYKAPQNLGDKPPEYVDFSSLATEWNTSRELLRKFLETVPDNGLRKKIYRHPVMGRCSVIHALKFFREHIIHHRPQIMRQL